MKDKLHQVFYGERHRCTNLLFVLTHNFTAGCGQVQYTRLMFVVLLCKCCVNLFLLLTSSHFAAVMLMCTAWCVSTL